MVNETKTCDSIKYDDDGERIVMLFGVNIAKKPTKVDDTIKISNNRMEDINYIHDDDKNENSILEQGNENENNNNSMSNNEKMKKEFEQRSEKENDNDNNKFPGLAIVQRSNHERIKRVKSWTEKEHKAFLKGLKAVGKGRWKNISRNFVITKTPTQVASHAQKYFQRNGPIFCRTKRQSIFDMKLLDDECENSKQLVLRL
ncbi:transcription factor MYBS3 [Trifolium repens]|nr:transcription factor MYBS3 [Trifolium repens]